MNYWDHQQNNTFVGANEGIRGSVYISDRKDPVVYPKPRRLGLVINNPVRPLRCQISQAEVFDSKAGAELLDLILKKEGFGSEQSATQLASSPPFFTGSPPSRVANPLIQDARFGDEKLTSLSALSITSPSSLSSSSSSACKGGCARMKVGHKPAAVRVEGFECLNRDRRSSRISAVA
ncbi:uncharacterized protein LOC132316088 [Cornus florida]|uniref:uncharacterized protein LOC132316088 n=1 Tax=Cornus florida TaxID=4283 RepID=UPI00289F5466|nr:uncharacterized protein LOC132316088 [Cornus florida]XP_059670581.1 uncharacterized protein LOC132316088 [Cornus florida]